MTDGEPDADADGEWGTEGADRSEPLSELAERAGRDRPTDDDLTDLFERETAVEVDAEALWAQLERDELPTLDALAPESQEVREIDKHRYCHRCPHFSRPPAVECEHEGTTILELADAETFRVADCPVVLEEEALEGVW